MWDWELRGSLYVFWALRVEAMVFSWGSFSFFDLFFERVFVLFRIGDSVCWVGYGRYKWGVCSVWGLY